MGAYYEAVIDSKERYSPHRVGDGLKLMEHAYLSNEYCMSVEYMLLENPSRLTWLCDYHETDDIFKKTWSQINEGEYFPVPNSYSKHAICRYFINHSKKMFIDSKKLEKLNPDWCIHPLPILCNSETKSAGGGDYHPECYQRATWCNDVIEVVTDLDSVPIEYKDVTEDCLFFE